MRRKEGPVNNHICDRAERFPIHDARGVFCCYACPVCEAEKRARYRPEVLTNPNYNHDEPIEESWQVEEHPQT